MRVMATITEPGVIKKILAHLGMPTEPVPGHGTRGQAHKRPDR